jgi:hypothetical protein
MTVASSVVDRDVGGDEVVGEAGDGRLKGRELVHQRLVEARWGISCAAVDEAAGWVDWDRRGRRGNWQPGRR